jgi:hypothetical protein
VSDMFTGRVFSIPYDTGSDQHASSIGRAQIITRTAAPGAVIQVGDSVMAYGVTPQQAKMGDIDVRMRSYHQLTNEAQDAVRRNIQWQYGEQVGDIKKGWITQLLGIQALQDVYKPQFPPVPEHNRRKLREPMFSPAPPRSKKAAAPASAPAPETAASSLQGVKAKVAAAQPKPKAAKTRMPVPQEPEELEASPLPRRDKSRFLNAVHAFSGLHEDSRGGDWEVSQLWAPDNTSFASVAKHKKTGNIERHDFRFDPEKSQFLHRYKSALGEDVTDTHLESLDHLHAYVRNNENHEKWAF